MPNLRISRRAAERLRAGHLWVYRTDIESTLDATLAPGSLVTVTDSRDIPLGTALYSSESMITARLISRNPALPRAQYLVELRTRIETAMALRHELAPISESNNAHRLFFSEADNLPGLVADRYNDLVLLQLLTQGTAQDDVRAVLVETLCAHLSPNGEQLTLWERPDPRIRELEQLAPPPPGPLFTNSGGPTTTTFTLNNLRFRYDAAAGQKTGAFLDQRLNYAAAAAHVASSGRIKNALDVCTYHGGFALHLAQVCDRVTGIDASRAALEAADANLALNTTLKAEVDWIEADAFEYLRHLDQQKPESFDAIVLDPPAFAKSKRAAASALRGYKELNLRALHLLAPGGTLITCSCSHHVSLADFTGVVASAAADTGRRVQLLEISAAAPDHPEVLTLPETRYLKCLICRVD